MFVSAILLAASAALATPAPESHGSLTLEERVAAQLAIEQVRLRHLTQPARAPRPEALRAIAAEKVKRALQETVALEQLWGVAVTPEMLRAEAERIGRDSHMPERLREMSLALGDDAVLFQECVARTTLVERLLRTRYAFDPGLHAGTRRLAERLRESLELGRAVESVAPGGISETVVVRVEPRPEMTGTPVESVRAVVLSPVALARMRDELFLDGRPHADLIETREGFVVRYPLNDASDALRLVVTSIPKTAFDSWWSRIREAFPPENVKTVATATELSWPPAASSVSASPGCQNDLWRPSGLDGPPDARVHHTAVWTGTEMIVWGGEQESSYGTFLDTGARYDPAIDSWTPTSRIHAPSPRAQHVAVWTGREMVIWGGRGPGYDVRGDGARYNPATDSWINLTPIDAPTPRYAHTAVWTGTEMIVWGGTAGLGYDESAGARFDPVSDAWTPLPLEGAPSPRTLHTAVWTGSEMIVWGGYTYSGGSLGDGARYEPGASHWTPVSGNGSPGARFRHTAVWTGQRMIVFGGGRFFGPTYDGGSYDPIHDRWTYLEDFDSQRRVGHVAVWTGSRMIVAGGDRYAWPYPSFGRSYDPLADQWSFIPNVDLGLGANRMTAVWTGSELILWGGGGAGTNVGARYNPSSAVWTPVAGYDAPWPRSGGTSVWTGNDFLLWGGDPIVYGNVSWTGDRYDATLGTWSPIRTEGAPGYRHDHVAVWTGAEMVVWGGREPGTYQTLGSGGRYDPLSDSWNPTSTVAAPSPRDRATAVWSGSEVIVWGGNTNAGASATGGRYDPATDTWRPMSTVSAPSPRSGALTVWAGDRLVLWGGAVWDGTSMTFPSEGGRYDPNGDAWLSTSTDGAPTGRGGFTMASTGDRAIIWGGGQESSYASGAVYDPSADRWESMATADAPLSRSAASSVWTGHELIVWGGWHSSDPPAPYPDALDTGARYELATNTWTPMNMLGRPLGRASAVSAWTGHEMLIWGGFAGAYLNNGGAYSACRPNRAPVARAGSGGTYECTDRAGAIVSLDGSASTDPDSSPGTSDDILAYLWSDAGRTVAKTITAAMPLRLGVHDVALTVTDRAGATGIDHVLLAVQDTRPPSGAVISPPVGSCTGPAGPPVTIADDFEDVCDPLVMRSYDPAPGPFVDHGDHHVTVTAYDGSGNAMMAEVEFTIDLVPPVVMLSSPTAGGAPLPASLPLEIDFRASDDDAAAGDIVHETITLQGCILFDGATYGNQDGLLEDEPLVLTRSEACRMAARCGMTELVDPELRVEATDCGGNVGAATVSLSGHLALNPWNCGLGIVPRRRTAQLRRSP